MKLFWNEHMTGLLCVCIPFDGIKSVKLCANNNIYARLDTTLQVAAIIQTVKS